MKPSSDRILTTNAGSIPRSEGIKALLRARMRGERVKNAELSARIRVAVADTVEQQADAGVDVVSDGEMGKASFIAYTDERLTGLTSANPENSAVPASNQGAHWERRLETGHEWRAFREDYHDYLPRELPPSAPAAMCTGPISYRGQDLLQRDPG